MMNSQAHVPAASMAQTKPGFDWWLAAVAVLLAGLGVVMVLSASGIMADRLVHDKYFFFKKQAIFFAIGVALMFVLAWLPPRYSTGRSTSGCFWCWDFWP